MAYYQNFSLSNIRIIELARCYFKKNNGLRPIIFMCVSRKRRDNGIGLICEDLSDAFGLFSKEFSDAVGEMAVK